MWQKLRSGQMLQPNKTAIGRAHQKPVLFLLTSRTESRKKLDCVMNETDLDHPPLVVIEETGLQEFHQRHYA